MNKAYVLVIGGYKMKYASKFDHICHDLVVFSKENWFEIGALCFAMSIVVWLFIFLFSFL